MWKQWADLARARLAEGDSAGAAFAALCANDDGGPCPFSEPVLAEGWARADGIRARVALERRQPRGGGGWRPRAGSTQAAHAAGDDFDL